MAVYWKILTLHSWWYMVMIYMLTCCTHLGAMNSQSMQNLGMYEYHNMWVFVPPSSNDVSNTTVFVHEYECWTCPPQLKNSGYPSDNLSVSSDILGLMLTCFHQACEPWMQKWQGQRGWKIWTRYSGHCFSHLKWNFDMSEKIGHISLGMGGKSIGTTSQKLDEQE